MNRSISQVLSGNLTQPETIKKEAWFSSGLCGMFVAVAFIVAISGCSTVEVTKRERLVHEKLPRPSNILVCDFIANPADMPKNATGDLAGAAKKSPAMTPANIKLGRELGASIATQLVSEIRGLGMPAAKASSRSPKPKVNDIVLRGYIVSLSEGDTIKRVVIGFGYGASELAAIVEGYQMTPNGLRKLGSAKLQAAGGKTPGGGLGALGLLANANPIGLIVGGVVKGYGELSGSSRVEGRASALAKEIGKQLERRFKEEGWIK